MAMFRPSTTLVLYHSMFHPVLSTTTLYFQELAVSPVSSGVAFDKASTPRTPYRSRTSLSRFILRIRVNQPSRFLNDPELLILILMLTPSVCEVYQLFQIWKSC